MTGEEALSLLLLLFLLLTGGRTVSTRLVPSCLSLRQFKHQAGSRHVVRGAAASQKGNLHSPMFSPAPCMQAEGGSLCH